LQPNRNPDLRSDAVKLLDQRFADLRPYVRRHRLALLGLPGGIEPGLAARFGRAGPVLQRILGPKLSRRLGNTARKVLRRGQGSRAR
jgi:hypothetical protein